MCRTASVELQSAGDFVHFVPGPRTDAKHRDRARRQFGVARIRDEGRRESRLLRGLLQLEEGPLVLSLDDDLLLPLLVPSVEHGGLVPLRFERAVNRRVPHLRRELARAELDVLARDDDELTLHSIEGDARGAFLSCVWARSDDLGCAGGPALRRRRDEDEQNAKGEANDSGRTYFSPTCLGESMRDVLVVGGGPIGGQTARHLAAKGHDVLLVEEHAKVGEPVQCAGLFTPRIFDLLDFKLDEVFLNGVRGAHVWSPSGHKVELDGGKTMAVATDRALFDRKCVEAGARAGAEVRTGVKAVAAVRKEDHVEVTLRSRAGVETVKTRLLVGADGVQSQVAKWFDIPRAREIVPCYGAQVEGTRLPNDVVQMWVGAQRAPGFFSWMIPTNEEGTQGKVELGVDLKAPLPAKSYYDQMYHDPLVNKFLSPDAKPTFDICACIPLGPIKKTTAERVAVVGDAAAQAKPTSGGGVYTGLVCAQHLADVATDALEEDDLSATRMKEYHDRWYDDIGRELYVGWRLRKAFMHLSDAQVEELFHILDDKELLQMVNVLGDIDYPSRLAKPLMRKAPQLFKFSGVAIRSLFD